MKAMAKDKKVNIIFTLKWVLSTSFYEEITPIRPVKCTNKFILLLTVDWARHVNSLVVPGNLWLIVLSKI